VITSFNADVIKSTQKLKMDSRSLEVGGNWEADDEDL
jgi:hypothetical protein